MSFKPIITKTKIDSSKNIKEDKKRNKHREELITLEEERLYRQGTVAIKDLIAPSALRVESSFLQLGNTYLRTVYVITYPRYIAVGWSWINDLAV